MEKIAAIILAAGKGTRLKSTTINKVALPLGGKPLILHTVDFVEKFHPNPIIIVVGFAKQSVADVLKGKNVRFVVQDEQLGTGHAVLTGLSKLPENVEHVLVVYGDDAMFHTDENISLVEHMIQKHKQSHAVATFITIELANPFGIGRVVRDEVGNVVAIMEQKEADAAQQNIREVNSGCYTFNVAFLRKYLPKVEKHRITREYQLTDIVKLAIENGEVVETIAAGAIPWRGVNTQNELLEAEVLLHNSKKG